ALGRLSERLDQPLRLLHGEPFLLDLVDEADLRAVVVADGPECARVALSEAGDLLLGRWQAQLLLDTIRQLEQLQVAAQRAGAAAKAAGALFRAHEGEKALDRPGLLHGGQVLALEVLEQRFGQRLLVGELPDHSRDLGEAGKLAGPEAPLAGDDLVSTVL